MNSSVHDPSDGRSTPEHPRFAGIERIAVLRGGGLGDLLFAVPAIEALARAYPDATITLLGTKPAEHVWLRREGAPQHFVELPAIPGVTVGPNSEPTASGRALVEDLRSEHFDLAAQLHGGGRYSNRFLNEIGARHTIGTRTADAPALTRTIPYVYYQHEVLRWLEVAGLAGAAPAALEPLIRVTKSERQNARDVYGDGRATVVIHPSATDPRRRWPAERFARLAAELTSGSVALPAPVRVLIIGDEGERDLCAQITAEAIGEGARPADISDLSGEVPLGDLPGLLAASDLLVGNDSGPRHLAQAVGTPTASVYWVGNLINAGPLGREHHRVQVAWTVACPVCGRDATQVGWTAERCEHDVSFTADVPYTAVRDDVLDLLAGT